MQQLIQHLKTGETRLETVPVPQAGAGQVLIQTRRSLVSTGTERMLVQFGRAGLLAKARQQPERVKQVLEKIRATGCGQPLRLCSVNSINPCPWATATPVSCWPLVRALPICASATALFPMVPTPKWFAYRAGWWRPLPMQ